MNSSDGQPEPANETAASPSTNTPESTNERPVKPARRLSWGKKLLFTGAIFILLGLATELLLVLFGISFPLLYRPDEHCATRLKSHLDVLYVEEGRALVRTNAAGFRDVERQQDKPPGVLRIAVVGDSFTEAIQVPREKSYSYRLERMLDERGYRVQVLNFGVSGFGTAQELEMLRHEVLAYQPDLVILQVFPGNDIADNSRQLNPGQIKPYYELVDGKLKLDDSFREDPRFLAAKSWSTQFKSAMINASRSLQLVNKFYSRWKSAQLRPANINIGLEPALYQPPVTDDWRQAWQVTEALIQAVRDLCRENLAECLVLIVSNPIQVHPDLTVRESFRSKHQLESLFYPHDRLNEFLAANQISSLSLARTMAEEAVQTNPPVYFHGFSNTQLGTGHWNELGHQRAAESLTDHLVDQFLENVPR